MPRASSTSTPCGSGSEPSETAGADGVRVDVAPTAEALAGCSVESAAVLVIDVLRASTTIVTALGNGCAAIVPVADPDEARRRAGTLHRGTVLAAREGRGEPSGGVLIGP